MLNEQGGVVDDLIVYRSESGYRCVVNASTREKDLAWLQEHLTPDVSLAERELAMIAVQGPRAVEVFAQVANLSNVAELQAFNALSQGDWLVARTGYTGEDGVEVMLPADDAVALWRSLAAAGVQPIGLGARDTLRLEAGLSLYGNDLDDENSPLASNIGWTIAWEPADREFIGRRAIEAERGQATHKLTGLLMQERAVLRHGQRVVTAAGDGIITSGAFSPTMGCSIALARLPAAATDTCEVDIRGKLRTARIVKPPFVRQGKVRVS